MRFVVLRLVPHPRTPSRAIERIDVRAERMPGGRLALAYSLHGRSQDVRIPAPRPQVFADGLWKHTCFEAFVLGAGAGYDEFNFAPSGEFAAYRFAGYRAGMVRQACSLEVRWHGGLETAIPVREDAVRMGLAAVIEDTDGGASYWALEHPPGKPDFHHQIGFALRLDEIRD